MCEEEVDEENKKRRLTSQLYVGNFECAARDFSCVFSQLGVGEKDEVMVGLVERRNRFCLTLSASATPLVPFGHSPICPVRECDRYKVIPKAASHRKLRIGVCVLIESHDAVGRRRVFLTRRSQLRIFPHFWVLPGGHWEEGESASQAAYREVFEETGISLQDDQLRLLSIWESTFPIDLQHGEPTNHHIVLFYHAILPLHYSSIPISLQSAEVCAASWVSEVDIGELLRGDFKTKEVSGYTISPDSPCKEDDVLLDRDCFALGHIFTLRVWSQINKSDR